MLRATTLKASGNGLLRGSACSACRRSLHLTSGARKTPAGARSNLSLTSRRPLAVIDGRRRYAVAAEDDRGVVSYTDPQLDL